MSSKLILLLIKVAKLLFQNHLMNNPFLPYCSVSPPKEDIEMYNFRRLNKLLKLFFCLFIFFKKKTCIFLP